MKRPARMCGHVACPTDSVDPIPIEPEPIEPEPILSRQDDFAIAKTWPAARSRNAQPGAARLTLAIVGAAGALVGVVLVVALSSLRGDPPIQTASAASAASSATTTPPATHPPVPIVESGGPMPTWSGQRKALWARDGSKTITFELQAVRDIQVWASHARPVLVVQCLSRATRAYVVLGTSANFEDDAYLRSVRVQWDDEAQRSEQWEISDSAHELFAPDGVAFVRRLAKSNHLRFGFKPYNAPPATVDFAVQGFDQLAGLVASTCGWRL